MFKKLLIANRGEIACRIIETARRHGVETFAVYSEADQKARHTRMANRSICIGPASAQESYLNIPKIISVAQKAGVEAVHPGYGFLSENVEFAQACREAGIVFIGPSERSLETMGSKRSAKSLVESLKIPTIPGYHGQDQAPATLKAEATRLGFPLMIKATLGGGGKGMRIVKHLDDFEDALQSCQREAKAAFGDESVLLEKYIHQPRHIEVQIFGDQHGNQVHLFERDCSLQRRHQKIIEEAPATGVSEDLRNHLFKAALSIAKAIEYVGSGTVEFLVDQDESYYFMEMNTRLQVEHSATEEITGIDLVAWQLRVAAGETLPLAQKDIKAKGHAIEMRLYAEDPENDFLPSTGRLSVFELPDGSFRLDTGVSVGDEVSIDYDPLLAKLIVWGEDREQALSRAEYAMGTWPILGVHTNANFLNEILQDEDFIRGPVDIGFVDRNLLRWIHQEPNLKLPSRCAAIALQALLEEEQDPWTDRTSWRLSEFAPQTYSFQGYGQETEVTLRYAEGQYIIDQEDSVTFEKDRNFFTIQCSKGQLKAYFVKQEERTYDLWFRGKSYTLYEKPLLLEEKKRENHVTHLTAPMTAKVGVVKVTPGAVVSQGQTLMVIEAMKMEYPIKAPQDGTIGQIHFKMGDIVNEGEELMSFQGGGDDTPLAQAS